jgi:hypothetical protein
MDKTHLLGTSMIVWSLDIKKNPYRPRENENAGYLTYPHKTRSQSEYVFTYGGTIISWRSIKQTLTTTSSNHAELIILYDVGHVNVLARYNFNLTHRYWNRIKHVFRYFCGTRDMRLFYQKDKKSKLVGYADAGYLTYSHKTRSQSEYVFIYGGTAISW